MKFLYGYFNEDTKESVVSLADKYGVYTGYAKLHPNDEQNASEYMGCEIAEQRAWIKALQNRRRRAKIKLNTIKDLMKDIDLNYKDFIDLKLKRRFSLKIRDYTNEIQNINNEIKEIQQDIKKRIEIRDQILRKKDKN